MHAPQCHHLARLWQHRIQQKLLHLNLLCAPMQIPERGAGCCKQAGKTQSPSLLQAKLTVSTAWLARDSLETAAQYVVQHRARHHQAQHCIATHQLTQWCRVLTIVMFGLQGLVCRALAMLQQQAVRQSGNRPRAASSTHPPRSTPRRRLQQHQQLLQEGPIYCTTAMQTKQQQQ